MSNNISIEFWNEPVQKKIDFFIKNLLYDVYGVFWETKPASITLRFSEKSIVHQIQLTQFKTKV
jgi:hypothetical protein